MILLLNVHDNKRSGIGEIALNCVETYLRLSQSGVNVGSDSAAARNLDVSVPQASCVGPALYLAYVNSMKEIFPDQILLVA